MVISMKTLRSLFYVAGMASMSSACQDTASEQPALGSLTITTSAPSVESEFATTDGWTVKYSRFRVNLTTVTVAGYDGVVTAKAAPQVFEQAIPGAKELLTSANRIARSWEDVSFEIGPATAESAPVAPVTEADRDGMIGTTSVLVEGTMTKAGVTKRFLWGLSPRTQYTSCIGRVDGAFIPGLVVPANGSDTGDIRMDGTVLFFDNLAALGHVLRGDPIAAADTNNDGQILLTELAAVPLDRARESKGLYGPLAGVEDLAGFLNAQARSIVVSFRAEGDCRITPIDGAP